MKSLFPGLSNIFEINEANGFEQLCLSVYRWQHSNNPVYRRYCDLIGAIHPPESIQQISFLPVELFRHHDILCHDQQPEIVFLSSGTTASVSSRHLVSDVAIYKTSLQKCFELVYGRVSNYCLLALLPSYLERENSSLVYMVKQLMDTGGHPDSGFFLYDHEKLFSAIQQQIRQNQATILIGVSFALLDFSEKYPINLPENFVVMETGGMKGKRRELVREELHGLLCQRFGVPVIHSEYGMTELLSQAYSIGNGLFTAPPWMQVLIRDLNDPFQYLPSGKTGAVNIIDLANINSCSFIATQDLGRKHAGERFEISGRFDNSDLRGCNLMIE